MAKVAITVYLPIPVIWGVGRGSFSSKSLLINTLTSPLFAKPAAVRAAVLSPMIPPPRISAIIPIRKAENVFESMLFLYGIARIM